LNDAAEAILCELYVLRCRRGDADAWRDMIGHFERRLLYYVRRLVPDERDAWDVLQQTWMAALRGLSSLQEPRALKTWLYRLAHNHAISLRRRRGIEVPSHDPADLESVPAGEAADEPEPWRAEAAAHVHAGLAELSLPHRAVLTLHYLEDLGVAEIAEVLDVPAGTVKSRLFHARRAMRHVLERRGVTP